jgi:hypothetical protein
MYILNIIFLLLKSRNSCLFIDRTPNLLTLSIIYYIKISSMVNISLIYYSFSWFAGGKSVTFSLKLYTEIFFCYYFNNFYKRVGYYYYYYF